MNCKLALKNVRKSIKDYAIYFLTLSFAVCIFYAFNSIGAQSKIEGLTSDNKFMLESIVGMLGYISIFVSVVLGCLIIYANNFLIKRRKKELGLYMSLGMGKRKIAKLLVVEEFIIGILSLVCGLISGIVVSQLIGVITNKVFMLGINKFQFIFSATALARTIFYFSIIFILVMIFNVVVISKYKLIDLLSAKKKNEKVNAKNSIVASLIFILSIVIIGIAYKLVLKVGFNPSEKEFTMSIILGIIGTVLFFYGIAGFIILVTEKIKKIYYRKINIFTVRQIGSKVNTNVLSMAVISLMLFITISLISVSVGFKSQNIDGYVNVDASLSNLTYSKKYPMEMALKEKGFKMPKGSESAMMNLRQNENITTAKVLNGYMFNKEYEYYKTYKIDIPVISLSDYNKYLELIGKKLETLENDQVAIISNVKGLEKTIEDIFNKGAKLNILGKEYKVKGDKAINISLTNEYRPAYDFVILANDTLADKCDIRKEILNINYGLNKSEAEEYISHFFKNGGFSMESTDRENSVVTFLNTKVGVMRDQSNTTSMILYIAIYIGAIFLIASAAVLALQQLSEASDSSERYRMLKEIGATNSQINKSIFKQTSMYFILPLILAIIHSVVGIYVGNEFIENFGKSNIIEASVVTMMFITVVYFGYFLVTYFGYRNVVRN